VAAISAPSQCVHPTRRAGGATPYDDGTRKNQLTLQCDVIVHF